MQRRLFLASLAALPPASRAMLSHDDPGTPGVIRRGQDRFGEDRKLPAGKPMWIKVSTQDTAGAFFLLEQVNSTRGGGPPRHFHFEQDEWFYSLEGDYVVEIGGKRYELSTGDSILAPRRVPHAFAFAGTTPGRLLAGFTPAGRMEEFFRQELSRGRFLGSGTDADRARLREYGMENVGPPLEL